VDDRPKDFNLRSARFSSFSPRGGPEYNAVREQMAKKPPQKAAPPPPPPRRRTPLILVTIAAAAVAIGAFAYSRAGGSDSAQDADAAAQSTAQALAPLDGPPANAKFGPHQQAMLPPLPFSGFPPARPVEVATGAYKFAAEHPEVLGYVPCYCGCERSGHRGNDDCFVAARTPSGDVSDWEPHGMT
jgi:Protein of unknown function with PCYCGC motif